MNVFRKSVAVVATAAALTVGSAGVAAAHDSQSTGSASLSAGTGEPGTSTGSAALLSNEEFLAAIANLAVALAASGSSIPAE